MELPVRIARETAGERVISVDGAWGAPGLNLSHWPGHRTPDELRHDLSTGSALRFARLPDARRRELAAGCTSIVNNHFDTDGTCALFAVRHPGRALELEDELLDAARAGDLFGFPNERAFVVDRIVTGLSDAQSSPIASELRGLADDERSTRATLHLLEALPAILRGDVEPYRESWERELERVKLDLAALSRCARDDVAHLDWTAWVAKPGSFESGRDPGRHALFGASQHDRALVAIPESGGTRYRFVINTTSWFDLVTRSALPRPDLAALAARLNDLEGTRGSDAVAWRAQATGSPSPELWFGTAEHELFAEHCTSMRESSLTLPQVRRALAEAQRAALALPE